MREILFRGKRKDNGEWIEGHNVLFTEQGSVFIIPTGSYIDDCESITGKRVFIIPQIEVIPETVGQYTGLTDKNGKKIFEWDIVKFCTELKEICFVDYGKGKYILRQLKKDKPLSWQSIDIFESFGLECEVIGNIHGNPELLKGA